MCMLKRIEEEHRSSVQEYLAGLPLGATAPVSARSDADDRIDINTHDVCCIVISGINHPKCTQWAHSLCCNRPELQCWIPRDEWSL